MPEIAARDVMTTPVVSVQPTTPLKTVARLLAQHQFRILPVVSRTQEVLGVVSERDFLLKQRGLEAVHHSMLGRMLGPGAESKRQLAKIEAVTAGEAMTSPAITVDADDRIHRIAGMMLDLGVGSLPVVAERRLVGVVARSDLVRLFTESDDDLADSIRHDIVRRTLLLPPEQFDVSVINGSVFIRGHVDRRVLADLLRQTIARHPGVIRVETEITWDLDDNAPSDIVAAVR